MCGAPDVNIPTPKAMAPTPPPTVRDADVEARRRRVQRRRAETNNDPLGGGGDPTKAEPYKQTLGG
jgi:hypothetical protein